MSVDVADNQILVEGIRIFYLNKGISYFILNFNSILIKVTDI